MRGRKLRGDRNDIEPGKATEEGNRARDGGKWTRYCLGESEWQRWRWSDGIGRKMFVVWSRSGKSESWRSKPAELGPSAGSHRGTPQALLLPHTSHISPSSSCAAAAPASMNP